MISYQFSILMFLKRLTLKAVPLPLKFIKVNNGFIIGIGIVSYVNVYLPVIV